MAIALPLLFQLFEPIQAAVQWLSGGSSASGSGRSARSRGSAAARTESGSSARFRPHGDLLPATGVPGRSTHRPAAASVVRPSGQGACPQAPARSWHGPSRLESKGRPLRVLRVVEGCDPANPHEGRLVISGRMADVCAELDRLAALEARH